MFWGSFGGPKRVILGVIWGSGTAGGVLWGCPWEGVNRQEDLGLWLTPFWDPVRGSARQFDSSDLLTSGVRFEHLDHGFLGTYAWTIPLSVLTLLDPFWTLSGIWVIWVIWGFGGHLGLLTALNGALLDPFAGVI